MRDFGILVVDDNSVTLDAIERMFSHFRIKVDCVMSAAAALDHLKTRDYSTLITDMKMPDMDGLELTRRARELFPELNIVLFSGASAPNIMELALNAKVSEVDFKPSGIHAMLSSVINKRAGKTFLLE